MKPVPVIAVFDVGKTNKKLLVFDADYNLVFERAARFAEIEDEDGFACENLESLKRSVEEALDEIKILEQYQLKAINFSAYGASFVYLDMNGKPCAPLYNYLKPYPEELEKQFYQTYGGKDELCLQTASPALGSLNSGLQLYRIRHQNPSLFKKTRHALHLPQYLSFLLTGQFYSDITSIGCHTALWDFEANNYHDWVRKESIAEKLPAIASSEYAIKTGDYQVGIGLHDSSAALIPYLKSFSEGFALISTGTWSISLNPFNQSPLTAAELEQDCLNYMQYTGKPVKASRFFIGHHYEAGLKQLTEQFGEDVSNYRNLIYDPDLGKRALNGNPEEQEVQSALEAYYNMLGSLVKLQKKSTDLVLAGGNVKQLFVDGGFSRNRIFMRMLAAAYPQIQVSAASVPQSTALGAALAIHDSWNSKPLPASLVKQERYI